MPLDKDILGTDLYNRSANFNDVDIDPEELEAKRLEWWKSVAEGIINHFKNNGVVTVNTTGTATAQHGTGNIT